ncbi:ROK family protein [Saccharococcus caldoxylosilyticus]|uniref:Putative sugar kinase n=1 Tax=Parageobacillus caldoxylosilyticus NBRC 107762 TaxID=1220594 RepID=A0A023DF37_9BACL|nr:ROK family protein [Parageobacillus caldoxylosilyticus]MBB3853107.1 putative NBD/HSP70 family sugar kinase [Parageobacillus caldoxylosilyticus]QXJ38239.1 Beta-glucoside kinase [Parageobacillus caldoxylosilyticus]BDG34296.1 transcriptional regulator [Parageobacillus caldoxylosilyticus]BDG38065.1 transcriptional regulator [Parageobacillus caldoxylosilyticus]BDG41844.1 transcriptional regulator [Parageobacillus caldoxylosilyticus]
MKHYMVFDIGGTHVKHAVMNETGSFLEKGSYPSERNDFEKFKEDLLAVVRQAKERYEVVGIAMSCPGGVDSDSGVIGGSSALPCIHGPNFKEVFGSETGLPVELENDANCAALGELWKGAAKHNRDVLFVVVGTGIGGAVVKDRKIHKGAHLHGGEFGYMIMDVRNENGNIECKTWSDIGATGALVCRVAKEKGLSVHELNGEKVFAMTEQGDLQAQKAIDEFYFALARGIFNIQYVYDPEKIILGGAISNREDFIEQIEKRLSLLMSHIGIAKVRPVIEKCHFKNDANLLGALYHYMQRRGELIE